MVVVAHPDDELLGLGASINKLINQFNCTAHLIILGEGITSRSEVRDVSLWEKELAIHRENIQNAKKFIGYQTISIYNFADNRFDTVPLLDIIKVIEKEKSIFQPEVVFTHHGGDVNIDHQRTFEAVITACRPLEFESVKTIVTFETPSGTEWRASSDPRHFVPNLFIEVDKNNLDAKIKGMQSYKFEKRSFPHPRSSEALKIQAMRWGIIVGVRYAEAFQLIRQIV